MESIVYAYNNKNKVSKISVFKDGMDYIEQYDYPSDSTIEISFWKDSSRISLQRYNEFSDLLYYHKCSRTITTDSVYIVETVEYRDSLDNPIINGAYAAYSISRDRNNKNVILEYFYDEKGEICKSEWFEYDEYGNRIARAVAGIEGKPVRCPKWDWSHMCYYKMSFIKNFSDNVFVAVKGIDEFGDQSYILQDSPEGKALYDLFEMPLEKMEKDENRGNITKHYTGFYVAQNNKEYNFNLREIPYLHILNKKGSVYNSIITSHTLEKISESFSFFRCFPFIGSW